MNRIKKSIAKMLILMLVLSAFTEPNYLQAQQVNDELKVTDSLIVDCRTTELLYNSEDELIAYYLEGDNDYAIIGVDGELIEYSDNSTIEGYDYSDNEKSYYAGIGEYYTENDNGSITNILTEEVSEKEDIQNVEVEPVSNSECVEQKENIQVSNDKKSVTITYPDGEKDPKGNRTYTSTTYRTLTLEKKENLSYSTRYFSYNTDGTCGSTAASILTYYYYDHISSSYIKNDAYKGSTDTKQKALVNHFKSLIEDDGDGSDYGDVKSGINSYLSEIGKSKNCKYITSANILQSVSSKIVSCIEDKKPCIVGLSNEPTYGNHWVVGVGYARYYGINGHQRGNQYFIKVNNGWYTSSSKNIVYVNYKYVDGVVYLD